MLHEEIDKADYQAVFSLLVDKLKGKGFSAISGRTPIHAEGGFDDHVKIVQVIGDIEICLKDCLKFSDLIPVEHFEHDLRVLELLFENEAVHPVKFLGRIDTILVMESVDNLASLFSFLLKNKSLINRTHKILVEVDEKIKKAEVEGQIQLECDPLVLAGFTDESLSEEKKLLGIKLGKAKEHAFVKNYDPETGSLEIVFIDPVR